MLGRDHTDAAYMILRVERECPSICGIRLLEVPVVKLGESDRAMLEYADQITRDATQVSDEHHARLRAAGFDDRGILQITLIAAWFNYINRVADALGVGTTPGTSR